MEYDAVVSDRIVAWRANAASAPARNVRFTGAKCSKKWEELAPTATPGIAHCRECAQDVVHLRSLSAIIPLQGSRCVWYSGGD
jgi:hypothetical protein